MADPYRRAAEAGSELSRDNRNLIAARVTLQEQQLLICRRNRFRISI